MATRFSRKNSMRMLNKDKMSGGRQIDVPDDISVNSNDSDFGLPAGVKADEQEEEINFHIRPSRGSRLARSQSCHRRLYIDADDDEPLDERITKLLALCRSASRLTYPDASDGNEEISSFIRESKKSWDNIRKWFKDVPDKNDQLSALNHSEENDQTALHFACKARDTPADVILLLTKHTTKPCQYLDSSGWTPLHHACSTKTHLSAIEALVNIYPDARQVQDYKGRTPVHVILTRWDGEYNQNRKTSDHERNSKFSEIVQLLAEDGAAEITDSTNMLPLHTACVFKVTSDTVKVLLDIFPLSVTHISRRKQTALHIAMENARTAATPKVVECILDLLITMQDGSRIMKKRDARGFTAISILVEQTGHLNTDEERQNIREYLMAYLNHKPPSSTDLLTALQSLPDYMRFDAVVNHNVQNILNERIANRFPTFILILDFVMLTILIVCFKISSQKFISLRNNDNEELTEGAWRYVVPLYVGASYFLLRELIQVISVLSLGRLSTWYTDSTNYVDMALIILIFYQTIAMQTYTVPDDIFRLGVAITICVLWVNVIFFIKSIFIDFAVFIDGVIYVTQSLAPFFLALFIILVGFSLIFYVVYFEKDVCAEQTTPDPNCNIFYMFLKVYSMLMGEVDIANYINNPFAVVVFVIYSFLVVILLSNVLIAIVTDAYGVVKDERAEMVFWDNRLDFVAEMDAIEEQLMSLFRTNQKYKKRESEIGEDEPEKFRDAWQFLMDILNTDSTQETSWTRCERLGNLLFRVITAAFIIPSWIILGFFSVGLLWPPQIRERMLVQGTTAGARDSNKLVEQLQVARKDVKTVREDFCEKIESNGTRLNSVKEESKLTQEKISKMIKSVREDMSKLLNKQKGSLVHG